MNPFVTKYTDVSQTAAEEFGFEVYGAKNYQLLKKVDKGSGILLAGPHGRYVYQGGFRQKGLRKYDLQEWREVKSIYGIDQPDAMALSPDGRILVDAATDQGELFINKYGRKQYDRKKYKYNIRIWDAESLSLIRVLENAHIGETKTLAFSPNGKFFVSGGASYHKKEFKSPHTGSVREVAVYMQPMKLWNTKTGKQVGTIMSSGYTSKKIQFSKGGKYLFVLDKGSNATINLHEHEESEWSLKVYDIAANRVVDKLKIKRTGTLYNFAINSMQTVLAVSWANQIWLYSIALP